MSPLPTIVYLDQNKWIQLAELISRPTTAEQDRLLATLQHAISTKRIMLPLTFANIYETLKINSIPRRLHLALLQCSYSGGIVFRGRKQRLAGELKLLLGHSSELLSECSLPWFLSPLFWDSVYDFEQSQHMSTASPKVAQFMTIQPDRLLFSYFVDQNDSNRRQAVQVFSREASELCRRIEARRAQHALLSLSERRQAYREQLLLDDMGMIISAGREAHQPWHEIHDIDPSLLRRLVNDLPTLFIECELALKLESGTRPINENDARDMQSFCTVLPYADVVVAEKHFVNLARQAGLGQRYDCQLETDLFALCQLRSAD